MYNGDLISREQAIEEIKSVFEWHDVVTVDRLVEHIKALPSAEPVIRCKDCEHDSYCCRLSSRTQDDYCSHAERKNDE